MVRPRASLVTAVSSPRLGVAVGGRATKNPPNRRERKEPMPSRALEAKICDPGLSKEMGGDP